MKPQSRPLPTLSRLSCSTQISPRSTQTQTLAHVAVPRSPAMKPFASTAPSKSTGHRSITTEQLAKPSCTAVAHAWIQTTRLLVTALAHRNSGPAILEAARKTQGPGISTRRCARIIGRVRNDFTSNDLSEPLAAIFESHVVPPRIHPKLIGVHHVTDVADLACRPEP